MIDPADDLSDLRQVFDNLKARNDELGLRRHDPTDVDASWPIPWLTNHRRWRWARGLQKLVKAPLMFMPITWRKILRVPRSLSPTVFYHLANAYRCAFAWAPRRGAEWRRRLVDMGEGAMRIAVRRDGRTCWGCNRPHTTFGGVMPPDEPCSHFTTRLGYLMIALGTELDRPDWREAGVDAACAMCELFNWHDKPRGGLTVSYFPLTDDETINILAEAAMLLARAWSAGGGDELRDRARGLIRTILDEQDDRGRWGYRTAAEYDRTGQPFHVDSVHTAMTISGLVRALRWGVVDGELADEVVASVDRGCEFHFTHLVDERGSILCRDDNDALEGSAASYGETVACIHDLVRFGGPLAATVSRLGLIDRARKSIEAGVRSYVLPSSWDVASQRRGGAIISIRSLRWGSGPIMEGISRALAMEAGSPIETTGESAAGI